MTDNDESLDLSDYSTAAGAAKALHKYLTETFDANAKLYRPEENPRQNGLWGVSWEGGPTNWAVNLTGGESMYADDMGRYGMSPEVEGFASTDEWLAEPHFSFDLQFSNQ